MTFEEAKNVSLVDLCTQLGGKCVRVNKSQNYALFHAPYREDRHPSLTVNLATNRWRDLAEDVGGDAVDLVRRKFESMSARQALDYLADDHLGIKIAPIKKENTCMAQPCIVPLENRVLLHYVESRGISPALAKRYCLEAHKVSSSGRAYYTLAFPSRSGGYELRNSGFKGAAGPKDISVLGTGNNFLFFEGIFDFLSHQQMYGYQHNATYVVLNSTTMADRAADYVVSRVVSANVSYVVELWLDNDLAGRTAAAVIQDRIPSALDMSHIYADFADLNEFLIYKININR